jgi:hypothetical protein
MSMYSHVGAHISEIRNYRLSEHDAGLIIVHPAVNSI